jgi:hypothetical protein
MDTPQSPDSGMRKVVGGVELEIEYLPESYFEADELNALSADLRALLGKKEWVTVREFRARKMERYLAIQGNENAKVELYCNRPEGWSDILAPTSFTAIANTGQELNLPFFQDWYRRLKQTSEAINPGLLEKVQSEALKNVQLAQQASPSANSPQS